MPLYEYACRQCDAEFELLVRGEEKPACPRCGAEQLDKRLSVPAAPAIGGSALPICAPPASSGGCGAPWCGQGGCRSLNAAQ